MKLLLITLVCLAGTNASQAGYIVNTNASISDYSHSVAYGYNYSYIGQNGPTNSPTGTASSKSCAPADPCAATQSGTLDNTGTATSASDSVTLSDYASGAASVYANLSTGKIGGYATGTAYYYQGTNIGPVGFADGYLRDVLHFNLGGLNSATIGVGFSATGTEIATGNNMFIKPALTFNDAQAFATVGDNGSPFIQSSNFSNWTSAAFSQLTPQAITFNGTYTITPSSLDIPVELALEMSCGGGDTCDFSHTQAFSLALPTGVTYTSDSGVFLSAQNAATPEPGTAGLILLGLAVAVSVKARRRV